MGRFRVGGRKRASDRREGPPRRPLRDRNLEQAIGGDDIAVSFQPQIDLDNGQVRGVEALARWKECASAEALFDRADAAQLGERLSRAIQRRALSMAARWEGPLSKLDLSINVRPEDLARPGYENWLIEECHRLDFDPRRLTIEIVETGLMPDSPDVAMRLNRLRSHGIRIAIDDFGTGYANLAYLTTLPLDSLKIDRGLVAHIVGGSRDRIVVKAMIALARELGLKVVVEGVETPAQLALLSDWDCDLYQGFLGAAPLDEAGLAHFVAIANATAA